VSDEEIREQTVGSVGSPSTTAKVTVDILETASNAPLLGELVYLSHPLENASLLAIGTVTEILTSNRWHEDPNMRGVLKRYGSLPHLSAVGDVRTAEVLLQAAYEADSNDPADGEPPRESGAALSMSPTTGAEVSRVTNDFLTQLLRRHSEEIVYLGHIHGTIGNVRLPLTLRHFGRADRRGSGEAYHIGVFGMTGSGKSGFAAYLIAAQLRHPEMGVLIIDPQGQFTSEIGLPFPLQEWAENGLGRPVETYAIAADLRLPKDAILLADLLGLTRFFRDLLRVRSKEWRESAVQEFTRALRAVNDWESRDPDEVLRIVVDALANDPQAIARIYSTRDAQARLVGALVDMRDDPAAFEMGAELFRPLHSLFTSTNPSGGPRHSIYQVLERAFDATPGSRPLVILDFSSQEFAERLLEESEVKARILRIVCSIIERQAQRLYREDRSLNYLVVFDEAHRFAAQDPENDEIERLSTRLIDYVRTTRKFGLGWMFITQAVSSLRRLIYDQLRVKCFGYGLNSGTELARLRETIAEKSALDIYRAFVDPDAISPSRYPFMLTGPVSPLSFTGAPLFLSVYTDFEEYKRDNGVS
jgi:hypothetical protein